TGVERTQMAVRREEDVLGDRFTVGVGGRQVPDQTKERPLIALHQGPERLDVSCQDAPNYLEVLAHGSPPGRSDPHSERLYGQGPKKFPGPPSVAKPKDLTYTRLSHRPKLLRQDLQKLGRGSCSRSFARTVAARSYPTPKCASRPGVANVGPT